MYVTTDLRVFHQWLSDLAGTVIETHLRQRRPHRTCSSPSGLPLEPERLEPTGARETEAAAPPDSATAYSKSPRRPRLAASGR